MNRTRAPRPGPTASSGARPPPPPRSRAPPTRTAKRTRSGTPSPACPDAIAGGDTPEVAVRPLPPDARGRRADEGARPAVVPLLDLAGRGSSPDDGAVNPAGLDFYSRLVDELLGAGILPWLTLYHWDLPQALEEKGGWANRDTAYRFRDYADRRATTRSATASTHWTTFNEPLCSSLIGYAAGEHAPGRREPRGGARRPAPPAPRPRPRGRGRCASRPRDAAGRLKLGITLNLTNAVPDDPADPADVEAARRIDGLWNRDVPRAAAARARTRRTCSRTSRGHRLRGARARRRPGDHRRSPSTSSA